MIFSVIGNWLKQGFSPLTGKPVTETRRIVKPGHLTSRPYPDDRDRIFAVITLDMIGRQRNVYRVGDALAIQLGRGKRAIGRTQPIKSITRQDVHEMMPEQAIASGFPTVLDYLLVWTGLHDPTALNYANCDLLRAEYVRQSQTELWITLGGDRWLRYLGERPAVRYDAWVISW